MVEGELAPLQHSASHLGEKPTSECPGLLTSKPDYLVRIQITPLCTHPTPVNVWAIQKKELVWLPAPTGLIQRPATPRGFFAFPLSPFPFLHILSRVNNAGTSPRHGSLVSGLRLCRCAPETKLHYCQMNQGENKFSQCWMPGPLELIISFRKHFYNLGRKQGRTAVYIKNTGIFPYLK